MNAYMIAPLVYGTQSFYMRYRLYSYCIEIIEQCGYDLALSTAKADRIFILGLPGWEQCEFIGQVISDSMNAGKQIEVVELEEFL